MVTLANLPNFKAQAIVISMEMTDEVAQKIEKFFKQYRARKYSKGQVLILNGDTSDYIYHRVAGRVKQYDVTYRGDEIILNIFKPPAFFPMSLAINKGRNPYIFEADTDIEVRQAPAEAAVKFLKDNPDVTFDLLSRLYKGTDGLLGRITHLMSSSAKSRLIYELLIEARRFGTINPDGSCNLTINEKDLGARAGLSRETVSREMTRLKADKLVSMQHKHITITSMPRLQQLLSKEV